MPSLGLIQSRGLGDIVIALPIAKYYRDRGWSVHWPIDRRFLPSFQAAVDYVEFIPFDFQPTLEGFLGRPLKLLQERRCDKIVPLYSFLTGAAVAQPRLAASLKFDEYKYAVTEVPFAEKWNLQVRRDPAREEALYQAVAARPPDYVVTHLTGSDCRMNFPLPAEYRGAPTVTVDERTDCIFDWLGVFERARALILIDSCFANLVEQLGLAVPKTFLLRSDVRFTPVLKNRWRLVPRPATSA